MMTAEIITAIMILKLLDVLTVDCIDAITDDVICGLKVSLGLVGVVIEMIVVNLKELTPVIDVISSVGVGSADSCVGVVIEMIVVNLKELTPVIDVISCVSVVSGSADSCVGVVDNIVVVDLTIPIKKCTQSDKNGSC